MNNEDRDLRMADVWRVAAILYDVGWRSTDKDGLIEVYKWDEDTATAICEKLKEFEK